MAKTSKKPITRKEILRVTTTGILSIYDTCYKMGVIHACNINDIGYCRQYIEHCENEDMLCFRHLESDVVYNHRAWRFCISSWVATNPKVFKNKHIVYALKELNGNDVHLQPHNMGMVIITKEYYIQGVKDYIYNSKYTPKFLQDFRNKEFINWAKRTKESDIICLYKANSIALKMCQDYCEIKSIPIQIMQNIELNSGEDIDWHPDISDEEQIEILENGAIQSQNDFTRYPILLWFNAYMRWFTNFYNFKNTL